MIKILMLFFLTTSVALADDFVWRGYVSQSIIKQSSTNKVSEGTLSRNEFGLYGTYQLNQDVSLRGMVSRIGDDDRQVRINYLLADIGIVNNGTLDSGIRIGRVNYVQGFYNESRNAPDSRDWEFPNQSIYPDMSRYFMRSGDGFQPYLRLTFEDSLLDLEASYLKTYNYPEDDISEVFYMTPNVKFNANDGRILGFNSGLIYLPTNTRLRYYVSKVILKVDQGYVNNGKTEQLINYLGLDQHYGATDIKLEYMTTDEFGIPLSNHKGTAEAIDITQDLSSRFSLLYSYDQGWINNKDRKGYIMNPTTPAMAYQNTRSVGLIYRYNKWKLRGEYHNVHGTYMLDPDRNIISNEKPNWNYSVLTAIYNF
jgi:hypothetical protein